MNLHFNPELSKKYENASQKIRILSENWLSKNMYCPVCGNEKLKQLPNNSPVADFQCDQCGAIFELKSHQGAIGKRIPDGAYSTMMERITSNTNPDLFILQYTDQLNVSDLLIIPRFFFVPDIIEMRKPLSDEARRSGWVSCNILYQEIPLQAKIPIIANGYSFRTEDVIANYNHIKQLQKNKLDSRGWIIDILNCINAIQSDVFTLKDMYQFHDLLKEKYPANNNIEAKIRQQLQFLRDKGFIEFFGNGYYKKL